MVNGMEHQKAKNKKNLENKNLVLEKLRRVVSSKLAGTLIKNMQKQGKKLH